MILHDDQSCSIPKAGVQARDDGADARATYLAHAGIVREQVPDQVRVRTMQLLWGLPAGAGGASWACGAMGGSQPGG
eukprot:7078742-Alexandrium_andersonii.AAC.1